MTCIVGVIADDAIYLGADTAVNEGHLIQTLIDKKVFKKGPYGIGFAGSLRVGQLVKYRMKVPVYKKKSKKDPVEILAIDFVDAMRDCLKDGGASRKTELEEEEQENDFLIAYRNRLFVIDAGYAICEISGDYAAIGSGSEYALGSLHATEGSKISPKKRIEKALEAAEFFTSTVSAPFEILKIVKN